MNKILSQALKKAVSEYSPEVKEVSKGNRPDLFSLSTETELFQNEKGIIIKNVVSGWIDNKIRIVVLGIPKCEK